MQLAGEWNGRQLPVGESAEWAMQKLEISREEYRRLARQFNPACFDAEAWAQLAQDAGMKYLAVTAKHHDGLALYHSEVSGYNTIHFSLYYYVLFFILCFCQHIVMFHPNNYSLLSGRPC